MRQFILLAFAFLLTLNFAKAQGLNIDRQGRATEIIERLSIKYDEPVPFHLALQPYNSKEVIEYAKKVAIHDDLSEIDRANLQYLFDTNNEWLAEPSESQSHAQSSTGDEHHLVSEKPILRYFYRTPANLYELNERHFYLRVNPLLNFRIGNETDASQPLFFNQRGLEIRGGVDDKVYFYTNLVENQTRFPAYVNERITEHRAIPGFGLYKRYTSNIFDIEQGYDFLNSQAYIGANLTKHIGVQFGHDRVFLGNGIRSNLLSDFSNNYLNLRINWNVGKVHYQNIFAELAAASGNQRLSDRTPRKFMAAHYFNLKLRDNLEFGFLEATIFDREDGLFEFQYLNPVILYRTVEQFVGSPDNILVGLNGRWDAGNKLRLYGQLMMDEFKFNELFIERRGWWANKFAIQAGLKTTDLFGVPQLDAQLEYNSARPFTYTHRSKDGDLPVSYSNYNQALAHPLGANFREVIGILSYQPHPQFLMQLRSFRMQQGLPEGTENNGSDILEDYNTRESDFGNETLQGNLVTTWMSTLEMSYELKRNFWLDLDLGYRMVDEEVGNTPNRTLIYGGVRWNTARYRSDY